MTRKTRNTRNTLRTPAYVIQRGEVYPAPLYDLDGNLARFATIADAQSALPKLVEEEKMLSERWGYCPSKLTIVEV